MKSVILGLAFVLLMAAQASAAGRCPNGNCKVRSQVVKVYPIPTVGKTTYTVEHSAVSKCKDGKCRLSK
jgi:hypothetical protein